MEAQTKRITAAALRQAERAAKARTFGVGGVLIEIATGRILDWMRNRVLNEDGSVNDPTAHVEHQIIDKYLAKIARGVKLPGPDEVMIVSTLDPCMMCGGAALSAGIKVVSMDFDDFVSVNHDKTMQFDSLPQPLVDAAKRSFGYFGVEGDTAPQGLMPPLFADGLISPEFKKRAEVAFLSSLGTIRALSNAADDGVVALSQSEKVLPGALGDVLLAESRGGRNNAAAIVAPDNRILLARGGEEDVSPLRTAFKLLTRDYAAARSKYGDLPHPKHCRVILLKGPGQSARDISDMGAFGSTMEGEMSGKFDHLQYVLPSQHQNYLDKVTAAFPPFYSSVVKVRPVQVKDTHLISRVWASLG